MGVIGTFLNACQMYARNPRERYYELREWDKEYQIVLCNRIIARYTDLKQAMQDHPDAYRDPQLRIRARGNT
jgi:hypothetical protein